MTYEEYKRITATTNITYEQYKQITETLKIPYEKYLQIILTPNMTHEEYNQIMEVPTKSVCNIERNVYKIFEKKWNVQILFELGKSTSLRFGQLKKIIPNITNTMLTNSLRELEELGVINRTQFNEIPPRVEYSVTESGKNLLPIFFELAKWSITYSV